jgi:F-type H+-transporting ATPase subunit delta
MTASVAGRYASALFDLAKEEKALGQVESQLKTFQGLLENAADLRRLVRSPVISRENQAKALAALCARAGITGLTANFLNLLAHNRRLAVVGDVIAGFRALLARERGEVSAEVTTAHALSAEQLDLLKATLRSAVGKNVAVNTRVDPNQLGGLIVKVGSKMIDSSLRTKLNTLKAAMKGIP